MNFQPGEMKSYKSMDRLDFGKHKGLTIDRVVQIDPAYIRWMYKNNLCDFDTMSRWRNGEFCADEHFRLLVDESNEAFYADNIDELTSWIFKVPDIWQVDFDHLRNGRTHLVSPAFRKELQRIFPKFAEQFGTKFAAADESSPLPTIPDPI